MLRRLPSITVAIPALDDGTVAEFDIVNVTTCASWASLKVACVHQYSAASTGPEAANVCAK